MAIWIPSGAASRVQDDRQLGRLHVFGHEWGGVPGATDFWRSGASYGQLGSAGGGPVLADYGFTTTSMAQVVGSGADFGSKADIGTPNSTETNAASDLVASPVIFGDFMAMEAAAYHLGVFPSYLMMEAWITFKVASNNETATAYGFYEDGGSPIVANDAMAMVYSNGTNFGLRSGADSDAGIAVQTTPFGVRIRIGPPGTTDKVAWYTRASATAGWVAQGTIDLQADEWPAGHGYGTVAAGSNTIAEHWVHIWYSEDGSFPT